MIIFKKFDDLQTYLTKNRAKNHQIGFVPTMGALHNGHISLIRASQAVASMTICSIFVNPYQFNDPKDYEKYPVSTEKDIEMLEKATVDILFLPEVKEIYPYGSSLEKYELGYLETILEGRYRPGHYQGVCQVMSRLLKGIKPDQLFMGQKDFQQCLVVKELIRLLDLRVEFHSVPTQREPDGLAMSSRNSRLNPEQRKNALAISAALQYIRYHLSKGDPAPVLGVARQMLETAGFKTDYIAIAKSRDLRPIISWNGKEKAVALIAAFQGEVRLIDNMLVN
ncbi:MAG: pantoate--beta-alanine ligase [Bacteroidota bacterium]|nr:pantoate--beta-alanine ligase [Bacteroidota bacterium]